MSIKRRDSESIDSVNMNRLNLLVVYIHFVGSVLSVDVRRDDIVRFYLFSINSKAKIHFFHSKQTSGRLSK